MVRFNTNILSTLKEVGDWLKQNGDAIYGTDTGPFPPSDSNGINNEEK